jgi:hypothetical protein
LRKAGSWRDRQTHDSLTFLRPRSLCKSEERMAVGLPAARPRVSGRFLPPHGCSWTPPCSHRQPRPSDFPRLTASNPLPPPHFHVAQHFGRGGKHEEENPSRSLKALKSISGRAWWFQPVISALWRLRQEDCEFLSSLGYRDCKKQQARTPSSKESKVLNDFSYHKLFFFFFLVRLKFEVRASYLQSWHSIAWATPPVHFALVSLEMGVS